MVHLSDTHTFHKQYNVPTGDILIHTGDFCRHQGAVKDFAKFDAWLKQQPHPYKLVVLGNHDMDTYIPEDEDLGKMLPSASHVFQKEEVTVMGLRIFGVSWNASMIDLELPKGLDILLSHDPPKGILDTAIGNKRLGDPVLRNQINVSQPRYHFFGHVHEAWGQTVVDWSKPQMRQITGPGGKSVTGPVEEGANATHFYNGAQANARTTELVHEPMVIEIRVPEGRHLESSVPLAVQDPAPAADGAPSQSTLRNRRKKGDPAKKAAKGTQATQVDDEPQVVHKEDRACGPDSPSSPAAERKAAALAVPAEAPSKAEKKARKEKGQACKKKGFDPVPWIGLVVFWCSLSVFLWYQSSKPRAVADSW